MEVCRFAPSSTGPAHPGTLVAGLLAWLDARSRGARFILRIEDLDPQRSTPALAAALTTDLAWFGLDADTVEYQHHHAARHAAALDVLAAHGHLYPCQASRSTLAASGRRAPDGAPWYDNRGRGTALPDDGWRGCELPLRVQLPDGYLAPRDESGLDLGMSPAEACGDPVVRRRDGAIAYVLAVVVDDGASGVTRVVRGRDIAPGTATQVALQRLLGVPEPIYRHHLLLQELHGGKLSKCHGAVGLPELRRHYDAAQLCGVLAHLIGLQDHAQPTTPASLLSGFDWRRVRRDDPLVRWDGRALSEVTGD